MKNVLPLFASLLFLPTGLLAQDCPNGITERHIGSIGCGPAFSPEDLALVAEAVVEVDVIAAHPHVGPTGGVMTLYEVKAANIFKGPTALQNGTKFGVNRYGGTLKVDCQLIDHQTNSPRFNPGERWLLMLYLTGMGDLDVLSNSGMWKLNGDMAEQFEPDSRGYRQEIISKIKSSLESTMPLTWKQVKAITRIARPEKSIAINPAKGCGLRHDVRDAPEDLR